MVCNYKHCTRKHQQSDPSHSQYPYLRTAILPASKNRTPASLSSSTLLTGRVLTYLVMMFSDTLIIGFVPSTATNPLVVASMVLLPLPERAVPSRSATIVSFLPSFLNVTIYCLLQTDVETFHNIFGHTTTGK